ncbi:MAG: cob(I)yrinic acid a,c-diamide adenosyltransferase [Verrucomicrobiia bacterium]
MSIVTKTGDDGTTGLMFNRRVSKTDSRVAAYGAVDELNAALGMARALAKNESMKKELFQTQKELVIVMGELSVLPEDRERYQEKGFSFVSEEMVKRWESKIAAIEKTSPSFEGWDTPGSTVFSAALHVARTICRRAEREVWKLKESGVFSNLQTTIYLNRLSDWLWLAAQSSE